jgi:Tfp pilus assembly protein PilF
LRLGETLEEDKDFQNAIPVLKEAIRLEPESAGAHYALARAYKQAGETRLAAQEFQIVSGIKAKDTRDVYLTMLTETQRSRVQSRGRTAR